MAMRKLAGFSWISGLLVIGGMLTVPLWARPQFGGQAQAPGQVVDDLSFTMPSGWIDRPAQGPNAKAHFVLFRGGIPYCEMYVYCDPLTQPMSLDQAFQKGVAQVQAALQGYRPLGTRNMRIAGQDTIVHDFSYNVAGAASFTARAYILLVNNKIYNFFFNTVSGNFHSVQSAFDQIVSTVRSAPAGGPPNPAAGLPALGAPEKQAEGGLPGLTPEPAEAPLFKDADARFTVPLPAGTTVFRHEGNLTSYKNAGKKAYFQVWSFTGVSEAMGMRDYAMKAKTMNGKQAMWDLAGKEIVVALYTGGDLTSEKKATVTAVYPAVGLYLSIEVPIADYPADQEWIAGIIRGVRFSK
jgi:hypothetical protein